MKLTVPARRSRNALSLIALAICAACAAAAAGQTLPVESLDIQTAKGSFNFKVEVADTDATRERGLMFRKSLAGNRGMLFDFKTAQPVAFWMKNTLIPLDMLFIAPDGHIISIARDAAPMSETPIPSGGDTLAVVELAGGRAAQIGAEPGDMVHERRIHH
jgi:uncharacterized membrane protein (UPF0127 family)